MSEPIKPENRPPRALLSGCDMLKHHTACFDFQNRLNRLVRTEEQPEHEEHISRIKEDFRRILAQQRVGKADSYSEGEWDDERKRVRITKSVGKWNIYGYLEDKVRFVDGYEALHLMEMNRLLVYWNMVLMSMEQAYGIFLGCSDSLTLEEYQVYSTLMRAGFYLLKCDYSRKYQAEQTPSIQLDEETKCVWMNLYEMLRQPNSFINEEPHDLDTGVYSNVRQSMLKFSSMIRQPNSTEDLIIETDECSSDKREIYDNSVANPPKRFKGDDRHNEIDSRSKLDKFSELFTKFDIIRSNIEHVSENIEEESNVKLLFDMFQCDGSIFRKSEPPIPEYRILVRASNQPLLTASEVANVYRCQPTPTVPILLMQVAETLSVHCFLYHFCRLPNNLITIGLLNNHHASYEAETSSDDSEDLSS